MPKVLFVLFTAMLTAPPAFASDKSDVLAPIHQFIDGINKGDVKSALGACADDTSIIDEFAPHEWHGAGACEKWADDFGADAKKKGITDEVVTLGKPRHVDVTGDYAYVVAPADYAFKQNGKPVKETKATMAFALHKDASGWRMTGWSWARP